MTGLTLHKLTCFINFYKKKILVTGNSITIEFPMIDVDKVFDFEALHHAIDVNS